MAIGSDDRWVSTFRRAASDLNVAILTTFLERWPGSPRNSALLIDRHGRDVLSYAKVHTCDWGMEKALTPGGSFEVARLNVEDGFVDVGVMICADREFPESARELMLGGAELNSRSKRLSHGRRADLSASVSSLREHRPRSNGELSGS